MFQLIKGILLSSTCVMNIHILGLKVWEYEGGLYHLPYNEDSTMIKVERDMTLLVLGYDEYP